MRAGEIAIDLVYQARDQTAAGTRSAEQNMQRVEKAVSAGRLAFQALSGFVAGTVVGVLGDAARAAAEEQAVFARMTTALKNTTDAHKVSNVQVDAAIERAKALSFADDQAAVAIANLADATGSSEEALKRLPLAMDIARAKNISLEAASKLLGKVTDENVKVFQRWGINVEKGSDATQLFAEVQRRFSGQSVAYANTTQGALDRIRNAIDDWKESIGGALGPAQGFVAMLPGLQSGAALAGGALGPLIAHSGKFLALLNPLTLGTKALAAGQAALNLVMRMNPLGLVITALAALAAGAVWAYNNIEDFRKVVDGLFAFLKGMLGPVLEFIGGLFEKLGQIAGGTSAEMRDDVTTDFAAMARESSASVSGMKTGITKSAQDMEKDVAAAFARMKAAGVGHAQDLEIDATLAALGLSTTVRDHIADMVTGVAGKSEEQRDKIVADLQVAKLKASLEARGMSAEVVASIVDMVTKTKTELEEARKVSFDKFTKMAGHANEARLAMHDAGESAAELKRRLEQLPSERRIRVITEYIEGAPRRFGGPVMAQHGFHGVVREPTMFVTGEAGAERVDVTPLEPPRPRQEPLGAVGRLLSRLPGAGALFGPAARPSGGITHETRELISTREESEATSSVTREMRELRDRETRTAVRIERDRARIERDSVERERAGTRQAPAPSLLVVESADQPELPLLSLIQRLIGGVGAPTEGGSVAPVFGPARELVHEAAAVARPESVGAELAPAATASMTEPEVHGMARARGDQATGDFETPVAKQRTIDRIVDVVVRQRERMAEAREVVTRAVTMLTSRGGEVIPARRGFEGVVTRPTTFVAGEAGAERVYIAPVAEGEPGWLAPLRGAGTVPAPEVRQVSGSPSERGRVEGAETFAITRALREEHVITRILERVGQIATRGADREPIGVPLPAKPATPVVVELADALSRFQNLGRTLVDTLALSPALALSPGATPERPRLYGRDADVPVGRSEEDRTRIIEVHTHLEVDGRELARALGRHTMRGARLAGARP